jgi:DNA-binding response OmpR family regulator
VIGRPDAALASGPVGTVFGVFAEPSYRRPAEGRRTPPVRLAVLDRDGGFLQVLTKRLDRLNWEYRVLGSAQDLRTLPALRLNAVLVNPAALGLADWAWLERLSNQLPGVGVVVCTGPSTVADRVRGLRLGVDDWVTKPCHPEEVLARIEAVVRRHGRGAMSAEAAVTAGELEIRLDQFQAFAGDRSVELTRREFELIEVLAAAEGRVLERDEIYRRVWGYAMVRGDRSVDVFVRKLRQKLERASPEWRYIHTHLGVGYRFAPEAVEAVQAEPEAGPAGGEAAATAAGSQASPSQ